MQSVARKLFTIDPETGVADEIDLNGYDLSNGDGLLLRGRTLFVVQNRDNKVAVFRLSRNLTEATFVRALTDPDLDVPTTIDRDARRLYVVNARFGTTTPTDQAYHVVRLRSCSTERDERGVHGRRAVAAQPARVGLELRTPGLRECAVGDDGGRLPEPAVAGGARRAGEELAAADQVDQRARRLGEQVLHLRATDAALRVGCALELRAQLQLSRRVGRSDHRDRGDARLSLQTRQVAAEDVEVLPRVDHDPSRAVVDEGAIPAGPHEPLGCAAQSARVTHRRCRERASSAPATANQ